MLGTRGDRSGSVWLGPPMVFRIVSFVPGGGIAAAGVVAMTQTPAAGSLFAAMVFILCGAILSVRLWRNSVVLEPHRIVVRGVMCTRSVPRYRVSGVTSFGWLEWRTIGGRRRFTPLSALWTFGRAPEWLESRSENAFHQIRTWARSDGAADGDESGARHRAQVDAR